MEASVAAVEPLPLVPAMRTDGKTLVGIAESGEEDADFGERKLAARSAGLRVELGRHGAEWSMAAA